MISPSFDDVVNNSRYSNSSEVYSEGIRRLEIPSKIPMTGLRTANSPTPNITPPTSPNPSKFSIISLEAINAIAPIPVNIVFVKVFLNFLSIPKTVPLVDAYTNIIASNPIAITGNPRLIVKMKYFTFAMNDLSTYLHSILEIKPAGSPLINGIIRRMVEKNITFPITLPRNPVYRV